MAKTLYLMSDPETLFDVQHELQGWSDSQLTDRGMRQARSAGQCWLASLAQRPDTLVASTSERASDALELAWETAYGTMPTYERMRGLKGLHYGRYEGHDSFLAPARPYGAFFRHHGGESEKQLRKRMHRTLIEVMSRKHTKVALVASHADACAAFRALCDGSGLKKGYAPADELRGCMVMSFSFDEVGRRFTYGGLAWRGEDALGS